MTRVVIQPSYGLPRFRRHWADTIDRTVPFTHDRYARALDPRELAELRAAHPCGTAHFWGATAAHDRKVHRLGAGDVVLMTGRKQVLAVGEIGVVLRNPGFARALWRPDESVCNWDNVYSLLAVARPRIPYETVWALPGFTRGDNFMGMRLLAPERGATVLAGLGISTATADGWFDVAVHGTGSDRPERVSAGGRADQQHDRRDQDRDQQQRHQEQQQDR